MTERKSKLWETGQRHARARHWATAKEAYTALARDFPDFIPGWLELSSTHQKLDEYLDSRQTTLQAATAGGTHTDPLLGMAIARRRRLFEEAQLLLAYIDATRLDVRVPVERLVEFAMLVSYAGRREQALEWAQRALRVQPDLTEADHVSGLMHMFLGQDQRAIEALQRTIALKPAHGPAYSVLSRLGPATANNNQVDQLRGLLKQPGLANREEVHYAYALHNQLHALGQYEDAWTALMHAFRARRAVQPYDHAATQALFECQRQLFPDKVDGNSTATGGLVPIFIVGMHRSGTTLLERMLGGHADIADAGETYTFTAQLRAAADHFCAAVGDVDLVKGLNSADKPSAPASSPRWPSVQVVGASSPISLIRTSCFSARSPRHCRKRGSCTSGAMRSIRVFRTCARCSPEKPPIPTISWMSQIFMLSTQA